MPTPARLLFDRPRWTKEDARAVLAALEQRLYAWRRRVAEGHGTTFRELIVRPSPPTAPLDEQQPFEVRLPSGIVIGVPATFDAAALERLLAVLQARAC